MRVWLVAIPVFFHASVANASPGSATDGGARKLAAIGIHADVGLPDGGGIGPVVRPTQWLRLGAAYTHNGFASGVRGSITLDPIDFPLAPTLTVEGGRSFEGAVRGSWLGMRDDLRVAYNYANVHLGLELGMRNSCRVYLRGGASLVDLDVADFARNDNVTFRGVDARVALLGTAKLGFASYW
jgi:hypothetical protein